MSPPLPLRLLADCEWLHEPPPVHVITGTGLTVGALAALIAAPGVGKTLVATSIATDAAIGTDWLGFPVVSPKPVVYAVGEGHAAFPLRLQALRVAHGLQESEPSGVWYVRESFSLLRSDDVESVLDGIRDHLAGEAPGLIVLDPLAAFMAGGDENSTRDMGVVVAALNRIRAATGACVLVVHHTGWNDERERGSIALRAAMDVMYKLKQDDGTLTLECTKLRDGIPPAVLRLRLRPVAGSCVVELADPADLDKVVSLTPRQQQVLDALKAIVVDEPVTYTRWRDAAGAADSTFERTLALLVRSGYVMKHGKGRQARYAPPGPLPPTPISPPLNPHGGGPVTTTNPRGPIRARDGGEGSGVTDGGDDVPF